MSKLFRILTVVIGLIVVGIVGGALQYKISQLSQDARTGNQNNITDYIEPVTLLTYDGDPITTVHPGDTIYVHRHFRKALPCQVVATRFLIDDKKKPSPFYSYGTTTTSWMAAGEYDLLEGYEVPRNVHPGSYDFRLKNTQTCAETVYYTLGFSIPLTVVAN